MFVKQIFEVFEHHENRNKSFDVIAASAELGIAKPDPAIFQWALKQAGCAARNAVMIGDRMDNDIAPANRLGMRTVRLLRGLGAYHQPQSADEQPEYTIRSLTELLILFERCLDGIHKSMD